jgi:hypothetical protein
MSEDVRIDLIAENEANFGGYYQIENVVFDFGRFTLDLSFCDYGLRPQKRLTKASISLTPEAIGKMMAALTRYNAEAEASLKAEAEKEGRRMHEKLVQSQRST